jgi:hypothetical protein
MIRSTLLSLAIALLLAPAAPAQGTYSEGRALEFRTDLPWAFLQLSSQPRVSGVSPLRVPGPLSGKFWLTARGPGVEAQLGRVSVGLDEEGARIFSYGALPLRETILRAALYPGYAQLRWGDRGRGLLMGAAATGALAWAAWTQFDVWEKEDDVDVVLRAIDASTVAAERAELSVAFQDARAEENQARERRNLLLVACGVTWGVSLVDALLFSPRFHVSSADESSLTLGMRRKTRSDAILRSAVFPGLGQTYNGQHNKAVLAALAGLAVGTVFLKQQMDYDESVSELERVDSRLATSTSISERDALLLERERLFDRADNDYRSRNLALGFAAGVWALSVADAALAFDRRWGDTRVRGGSGFGLAVDPARGELAARLHF